MTKDVSVAEMMALLAKAERDLAKPIEDPSSPFHEAMKRACIMVLLEAKTELGTYQPARGPFPAWDRLADSTNKDRERKGFPADKPLVRTGDLSRSIHWTINGSTGHVGSDEQRAVYLELGTSRMPARSFLGRSAYRKEFAIHKLFARAAVGAFEAGSGARWWEMDRMVLPIGPAGGGG